MRKAFYAVVVVCMAGLCAHAQEATNQVPNQMQPISTSDYVHHFGAGVIVGEPTGASLKYWLTPNIAADFAGGWSFYDHADAEVQADLLWHDFNLLPVSQGRLPVYFGVGALGRFRHDRWDDQAGIRVPVGISYMMEGTPLDVFAEIGPALIFTPDVRGQVTGGIGVRYWF
ncbi:MAG: hypothetical protein KGJ60_14480 [Verrucomicrobiota bacterium]|nr:hypothetical protein [Verrucomicrobiota bacterium]